MVVESIKYFLNKRNEARIGSEKGNMWQSE